jgi:amino acid adenylation domain-containing protein
VTSTIKRSVEAIYPPSPTQQGMLFHSLLAPESGVYVEQLSCVLRGDLDIPAFERAWQLVVDRHSALRTAFAWKSTNKILQVVQRQVAIPLRQEDWRGSSADEQAARLAALLHADRVQGFDLAQAPLMRLLLLRVGDDSYRFIWTYHHNLFDGWSLPLILKDVFTGYEAFRHRREPHLPVARPYRDYIAWLQKQDLVAAEQFWRRTLAGATAPTPLVVDRDPAQASERETGYAEQQIILPGTITAELQALARQHQLTINTLVQGAWALLLSRYSGEQDIIFGATVSGRPADLSGVETMVGVFINALPVRVQVPPEAILGDWLREIQAQQFEQRQYEYSPLVQIHEWSELPRGRSMFESLLVFENYPVDKSLREQQGSLTIEDVQFSERTNYQLTITSGPGRELPLKISYDERRFDAATIERMLGHLRILLEGFAAGFDQPLATLTLLSEAERQQLLVQWNATTVDYPLDVCLHQLFQAQVERSPDATALIFEGQRLSYRQLDQRATQLAHYLRGLGVGPDTLVGVALERSLELVVALMAILKAGGAYVPLDPSYPRERLAFMLQDADCPVLLTQSQLREHLPASDVPTLCLDADWELIDQQPGTPLLSDVSAEHLAYVIYTSGSTGRPKGVMVSHRAIVNRLLWMQDQYHLSLADRVLQKTPFSFDVSVWEFFWPLITGATLVLARPEGHKDSAYLVELINQQQITTLHFVPPMLAVFLEDPGAPSCASLRRVICSGEALPYELQERFFSRMGNTELHNLYGPTEAAVDVTYWACRPNDPRRLVPIGFPVANTQMYVLDAQLQPVPVGVAGELHIGGVQVARGYLGRPELTREKFIADPFATTDDRPFAAAQGRRPTTDHSADADGGRLYKTGDLARYLADGAIEYLGRLDHQVKLRGFRIELGEIEAALAQHPGVREVVVVARESGQGDKRLVAYIVPTNDELADSSSLVVGHWSLVGELRAFLKAKLPEYMVPSAFVMLEQLPLSPNGKVDRKALPAPDDARSDRDKQAVAPRTPVEELLAGIWMQVLGITRVGVNDSFFELGGHSLLATQVISRLRDTFQVELPLRSLFDAQTVSELAQTIEAASLGTPGLGAPPIELAPRDGDVPLSFAQQRLWFLDQLEPGSPLYNNPSAVRLSGPLDITALELSCNEIVRRHEVLRTNFVTVDGRPVQVIAPAGAEAFTIQVIDLSDLPEPGRAAEAQRLGAEWMRQPFDMARGPMLRFALLRLDPEEHIGLLSMHHVVSDAWSIVVLIRELAALYAAFVAGAPAVLPDLPIQYADFAAWQRGWLQGETLESQLAYWKEQMRGSPALLDLPTDRPRSPVQTFRGATHWFSLPRALSDGLAALSRQEGATLFMTLLAAFQTLLYRYSGQEDICVGTPIANRTRAELEPLIGFFVNTLVMRTDLSGDPSFRAILKRVREVALGAYAHQDLPFEMLVEAVQPERNLNHGPLFQVMFAFDNAPRGTMSLPGLTLAPIEAESGIARFDLTLLMTEEAGGLAGSVQYNTDLFDAATIERLLGHLQTLLEGIVADPKQPIAGLPLLTAAERRQLLVDWNATSRAYPHDMCFHQLFEAQVAHRPDAPAVVFDDRQLSYRELNARANQLASYLQQRGVRSETLVGICLERSLDLVVAVLGVLKAGGAFLPLDPNYPPDRLAFMIEDSAAPLLLTATNDERRPTTDRLSEDRESKIEDRDVRAAETRSSILDLRSSVVGGRSSVVDLIVDQDAIARQSIENLAHHTTPDHLAYVIYTSGSTGRPKGTLLEHGGLCNLAEFQRHAFEIEPDRRVLQFAPFSFDAAVWELVMALGNGATLCLARPEQLAVGPALRRLLRDQRINTVTLPPSVLAILEPKDLPDLQTVIAAGEACSAELVARWSPGRRFFNAYGPTETTVCAALAHCDAGDPQPPPIGRALPNQQLYVLDTHGQLVPIGVLGELHIGGVGVARGYLNRPELSAERFVPSPFTTTDDRRPTTDDRTELNSSRWSAVGGRLYKSGDLVRYRSDGNIEFLGRIDHQVKLRGFRIELGEIEAALRGHPNVRETIVLAREDAPGDKRLVAYVVPATGDGRWEMGDGDASLPASPIPHPPVAELRDFLKQRLPEYMLPSAFVALDAWPLSPSGKVDRKALPAPDSSRPDLERAYVAPRTPTEVRLAELCAELLGLEQVGVEDNFFELGGHSLLATQLMARVRDAFHIDLPLRMLFEQPSVAHLAEMVESARDEQQTEVGTIDQLLAQIEQLSEEEVRALLSEQHRG